MKQKRKRLWALLLSAALIVTQLSAVAMAENNVPEDKVNFATGEREDGLGHGSIASFEPLPSGVVEQTVDMGTELSELNLPDTVTAEVYHITEDIIEDESGDSSTASPSNAGDSSNQDNRKTVTTVTTTRSEIPVTWDSEPAYDDDRLGDYVFTADVGGRVLSNSAELPQITVTVTSDAVENPTETLPKEPLPCALTEGCTLEDGHEGECKTKTVVMAVTIFDGLDDTVKYQTVPAGTKLDDLTLPATLGASGYIVTDDTDPVPEAITVNGVTWEPDSPWDESAGQGSYVFTPVLPAGYSLADGAELPEIYVRIGGAAVPLGAQSEVLTVTFDSNGFGGTSSTDNEMKTAIDNALKDAPGVEINKITGIEITGSADMISQKNWEYLCDLYLETSIWSRLKSLDLSQMPQLTAIDRGGDFGGNPIRLKEVNFPDTLTEIGDWTFRGCKNLTLQELPPNLKTIGPDAFHGCESLVRIILPPNLLNIGDGAFDHTSLSEVIMQSRTAPTLGEDIFSNIPAASLTIYVPYNAAGYDGYWADFNITEYGSSRMSSFDDADGDGFHDGDVAAFRQILARHPELMSVPGVDENDPKSWGGNLVGWEASLPIRRITFLYFHNTGLIGPLDVSGLSGLIDIDCSENARLAELTLGTQNHLTTLTCSNSGISGELDVSKCPELQKIQSEFTPNLKGLKLGAHNQLTEINCNYSGLGGELDVSSCPNLDVLTCVSTPNLTGLKLGTHNQLTELKFSGTRISGELDVSKYPLLEELRCNDTPNLTSLKLGQHDDLTRLFCSNTGISGTLDVSKYPKLTILQCYGNPALTDLKLGTHNQLTDLSCSNTGISGTLDVSKCPKLTTLRYHDNPALTGLKLGTHNQLTYLNCSNTGISGTLDVSKYPKLEILQCFDTPGLTGLKLGTHNQLTYLSCSNTGISGTLDVSKYPLLEELLCSDSKLEALNVSGTSLNILNCSNNPLTSFTSKDGKTLTVGAGTGGKAYITNYTLSTNRAELTAIPDNGYMFKTWSGLPAGAPNDQTTSFTLDSSITVEAIITIRPASCSGGGSSDDDSHIITPQPPKPNDSALAVIELPVTVENGAAAGKFDDGRTAAAITEAQRDEKARVGGIAVQYDAKATGTYDGFSIVIQRATLDRLIAARVKYVTLNTGIVDLTFDLAALEEIQKQSSGDITLTAARETGLAGDALASVGKRPAYRLTVSYIGRDGKPATVQNFGAGRVTVGLAYIPDATEQTGSLYLVYSKDGKGAEWLYQSSYDSASGNVIGSTGHFTDHFSLFGVGYEIGPDRVRKEN